MNAVFNWLLDAVNWSGADGIPRRVGEHVAYSVIIVLLAAIIAIPVGFWVGHSGRGHWLVSLANGARAVPSLGLLLAISLLLGPHLNGDLAFTLPSIIVLVVLAIPPILAGAYSGVAEVDPAARDAARGMGMRGRQVLGRVEVPVALPLLLSGVRSATLQVVATTTIAAFVGMGGLGRFLIDGLASGLYAQMAGGALLVALLALVADLLLAGVQRIVVSPGISGKTRRPGAVASDSAPAPADAT